MKAKPKAKQTGKPKTKRAGTTRGAQTAQGAQVKQGAAAEGGAHGETGAANRNGGTANYCREQVRRFISDLPKDCALICDAVKQSLFDDGAGLMEDETLCKQLGRIAYIDNFIRYFGDYLAVEDMAVFLNDLVPRNMKTAGGAYDLKILERVPNVDIQLMGDILSAGDDYTSMHNLTLYYFSLWVNFHVGAVVSMFRKWVEVYGENVPPLLRDVSALARCDCVYTRTEDNANGGIFFDGSWFESFAMCGERRRKRNAASCEPLPDRSATPAPVAGEWAKAQGVKNYNGKCFSFKGLCLERKPKSEKQWADIAAIVESTEPDGAAMLGKNWRGKFSNADDEYKSFTRFIHPLPERGAGWFRLEKEKIAERRKW